MRIEVTSVFVDDQAEALSFYTDVLGFEKRKDLPAGAYRWLTVGSPEQPGGVELLLEPNEMPAAKAYQEAIYAAGIPAAAFAVEDIAGEHQRLSDLGVRFTMPPTEAGGPTIAIFDDSCGNLIQLYQV